MYFLLCRYVHIGTGNYNPVTAGLYSDFSLFSCDPLLGRDVMDVFKHLTGLHRQNAVGGYRKLLVAQVFMRRQFVEMIDAEIAHAREGRHAAILLKVNGLDDRELVSKLYVITISLSLLFDYDRIPRNAKY